MIGTDLDLDLPTSGDSIAQMRAKLVEALSIVEDSMADLATPSALNINSALSFGGNHATNVGGLLLVTGNTPSAEGSVYYDDGSFWVRDATGLIKLTESGAINVAGVGGIGGDYGNGDELVYYDNASTEYRFFSATSPDEYADLRAGHVIFMDDADEYGIRVKAPDDLGSHSGNYTIALPQQLPASIGVVMMDDGGAMSVTDVPTVAGLEVDSGGHIVLQGSGELKHGDRILAISGIAGRSSDPLTMNVNPTYVLTTTNQTIFYAIPLKTGDRIKSFSYTAYGDASADITAAEMRVTDLMGAGADSVIGTGAFSNVTAAYQNRTVDCTDTTLAAGQSAVLVFYVNAANMRIGDIRVTYARP